MLKQNHAGLGHPQKKKNAAMHLETVPNLYDFLSYVEHKKLANLKNVGIS